jgi:type IV secretory pathway VirB10-like protein
VVSLASHVPEAPPAPARNGLAAEPATELPPQAFPPLPRSGSGAAAPEPPLQPQPQQEQEQQEQPQAAGEPAGGGNPLLAAFAAERRLLEELRDDVQAKLASFRVGMDQQPGAAAFFFLRGGGGGGRRRRVCCGW